MFFDLEDVRVDHFIVPSSDMFAVFKPDMFAPDSPLFVPFSVLLQLGDASLFPGPWWRAGCFRFCSLWTGLSFPLYV